MKVELAELLWLDEREKLSLAELAELSRLAEEELLELMDYGLISPSDRSGAHLTFGAYSVVVARTACRLRDDFELDSHGIAIALTLLERIRDLESKLQDLEARLPRWEP